MIGAIKGRLSAKLLGSKSHRTVSNTSLTAAATISVAIALLAAIFALAQWRAAENLVSLQDARLGEISRHVATTSDMANCQANAHRGTLGALLARDLRELDDADALRIANLQEYRDRIASSVSTPELRAESEHLLELAAQYEEISGRAIGLIREGRKDEALDLRSLQLRGLFDRWQLAHLDFSKDLSHVAQRQSDHYERTSTAAEKWLKIFLLAPLALIILGMVAIMAILGMERFGAPKKDTWSR